MTREIKFLGRTLNEKTLMWEFPDKSGVPISEELRLQMMADLEQRPFGELGGNALLPLGRLFNYKEKYGK